MAKIIEDQENPERANLRRAFYKTLSSHGYVYQGYGHVHKKNGHQAFVDHSEDRLKVRFRSKSGVEHTLNTPDDLHSFLSKFHKK